MSQRLLAALSCSVLVAVVMLGGYAVWNQSDRVEASLRGLESRVDWLGERVEGCLERQRSIAQALDSQRTTDTALQGELARLQSRVPSPRDAEEDVETRLKAISDEVADLSGAIEELVQSGSPNAVWKALNLTQPNGTFIDVGAHVRPSSMKAVRVKNLTLPNQEAWQTRMSYLQDLSQSTVDAEKLSKYVEAVQTLETHQPGDQK